VVAVCLLFCMLKGADDGFVLRSRRQRQDILGEGDRPNQADMKVGR
jgi:hypothetical protein